MSSASAWPRPNRAVTSSRPPGPRPRTTTGRPPAVSRWPRRRSARPNRSTPAPRPGPTPSSAPSTRREVRPEPNCWPGWTGSSGTLLDLVEVDSGWEEAFEAAAGASLAAVVVSGSEPARAALSLLRQGRATGAVLALTESASRRAELSGPATPEGTESIRGHVRPRSGGRDYPGLDAVLDTLLDGSCCAQRGWSEAIDLALARPDLVVVTRDGDRFSSTGWRVRAGGGVVTAAVVDEARQRAEVARGEAGRAAEERTAARATVESTREAAAEAVRADDRNEVAHQAARVGRQRVSADRDLLATELEDIRRNRAELDDRIGRDAARVAELVAGMPALDQERVLAAEKVAAARDERRRIEGRIAEAAAARSEWEVRTAGLVERRQVLAERLTEVERRLTGHAEERQQAAERRTRLESDATAVERLMGVVAEAQSGLDCAAVVAPRPPPAPARGGPGRRGAGWRSSVVSGRSASTSWPPPGAVCRRPSSTWWRPRSGASPWSRPCAATWAVDPRTPVEPPRPNCPKASTRSARVEQLETELAAIGPVNPLAMEELSELGERHQFLESQVEDVRKAQRDLRHVIRTLDEEIMHVFDSAFADVNEHFSNLITSLFPGGHRPPLPDRSREPAGHRGRGGGPPGRPQCPPPVAAVRRRAVAGGHGLSVRRLPQPPVAVLPDGRSRGRPRRREPHALPGPGQRVPGGGPADHREPPEAHDGGGRRPLRGDHGPRRLLQGGQPEGAPRPHRRRRPRRPPDLQARPGRPGSGRRTRTGRPPRLPGVPTPSTRLGPTRTRRQLGTNPTPSRHGDRAGQHRAAPTDGSGC